MRKKVNSTICFATFVVVLLGFNNNCSTIVFAGSNSKRKVPAQKTVPKPSISQKEKIAISLNNRGCTLINQSKFNEAIKALEKAVKLVPTYDLAKRNLGIAYNNFGLAKANKEDYESALVCFEKALFYDFNNKKTQANLAGIIKFYELDPKNRTHRVKLAKEASESGNLEGAIIHYTAANMIKKDATTTTLIKSLRVKRQDASSKLKAD